jgi:hypothetical protein
LLPPLSALTLNIVVVATPLVDCRVAPALTIVAVAVAVAVAIAFFSHRNVPVAFTKLLPPQLPCYRCCCRVAPTLALDVVVVAAPLVNCCVAAALAIVNLGCRCLDLMFRPFEWWPWYNGGRHGPWAMVLVFSWIVLFDSTWPKQSYQFLPVMGSHSYP